MPARSFARAERRRPAGDNSVRTAGADPHSACPCGSGLHYRECCEPLHDGAPAPTAQALMRSRFSAFVVGDEDYLFRTWHPRTRPEGPYCDPQVAWDSLEICECEAGGVDDDEGIVEFIAHYRGVVPGGEVRSGTMRERSRFERRAGRWVYLEAI